MNPIAIICIAYFVGFLVIQAAVMLSKPHPDARFGLTMMALAWPLLPFVSAVRALHKFLKEA